jgi:hypothetical protein
MILQKAIASPKEIVETSSDNGAGSLKAILAEIRDESKRSMEPNIVVEVVDKPSCDE